MKKFLFWLAAIAVVLVVANSEYDFYNPIKKAIHEYTTSPTLSSAMGKWVNFSDNKAMGMTAKIYYDNSWKEMRLLRQTRDLAVFYIPNGVLRANGSYEVIGTDRDGYTVTATIYVFDGVVDDKPF